MNHLFVKLQRMGVALSPDPDRYEHNYEHCDVLVVGSGPSGLSSALAAAKTARLFLQKIRPILEVRY